MEGQGVDLQLVEVVVAIAALIISVLALAITLVKEKDARKQVARSLWKFSYAVGAVALGVATVLGVLVELGVDVPVGLGWIRGLGVVGCVVAIVSVVFMGRGPSDVADELPLPPPRPVPSYDVGELFRQEPESAATTEPIPPWMDGDSLPPPPRETADWERP